MSKNINANTDMTDNISKPILWSDLDQIYKKLFSSIKNGEISMMALTPFYMITVISLQKLLCFGGLHAVNY